MQDPVEATACHMAVELAACYDCLGGAVYDHGTLSYHSQRFASLAVGLEAASPNLIWGVKPKLHLWQEMCEMIRSNPSLRWCYRDEDHGGALAASGRRRGGASNPSSTSANVLRRHMARHPVPKVA